MSYKAFKFPIDNGMEPINAFKEIPIYLGNVTLQSQKESYQPIDSLQDQVGRGQKDCQMNLELTRKVTFIPNALLKYIALV
jgi:hypothetical protein